MIRFECVNPATNADKFWEFDVLTDTDVMFRYGRRGTQGQSMKKNYSSFARMQAALEDAVREKLGKGYVPVKGNNGARSVLPPSSREMEIERGLSLGIQKQRERDAEEIESAWRKVEERGGVRPSVRGGGGGGGGSISINMTAGGGGGAGGLDLPLKSAADAMRGIGEAFDSISRAAGSPWAVERIRGGPRMGQPRPCPHPDLSKTMDGYVCRSCGKSVGPAAAPEVATVLTLKVKRKIVLDD